jgi:hypothetical protein
MFAAAPRERNKRAVVSPKVVDKTPKDSERAACPSKGATEVGCKPTLAPGVGVGTPFEQRHLDSPRHFFFHPCCNVIVSQ